MMKVIVTGGLGFIGSNLVERLVKEDYEVTIFDNYHTGSFANVKEFYDSKVYDLTHLRYFGKNDVVFHFGTPSSSPMYKRNPLLVSEAIRDFIRVLEYCKRTKSKLVFASSSSLYNGNYTPFKENMSIKVTDYYTEARYSMERLAELYSKLHKVRSIGLRLFSVYGPREEHKKQYANVITQFLWKMLKDEQPVIYGDGTQTRDFIHVSDVVDACMLAMNYRTKFEIFNIGTGDAYSFNDVVELLNLLLLKDISPKYIKNPVKNYVKHTLADTRKAERKLKFKSKVDLEKGARGLVEYYLYNNLFDGI